MSSDPRNPDLGDALRNAVRDALRDQLRDELLPARRGDEADQAGSLPRARGWRMERRHAVYRSDLLWSPRALSKSPSPADGDLAQLHSPNSDHEPRAAVTSRTEIDTARAYDMLRTGASLVVPLLHLTTKS